jgi:alkyl hydroperoxide reductase subunit AhpC
MAWQRNEKSLENVKFQMAADPTGAVSRMFGVYDEATGLALRGTFIISPEGTIFNSEVNFYNMGRSIDELLRKLKANLYLAKHGDEGCPAQWKEEGDKTWWERSMRPSSEALRPKGRSFTDSRGFLASAKMRCGTRMPRLSIYAFIPDQRSGHSAAFS